MISCLLRQIPHSLCIQCPISTRRDISSGLFVCNLFLQVKQQVIREFLNECLQTVPLSKAKRSSLLWMTNLFLVEEFVFREVVLVLKVKNSRSALCIGFGQTESPFLRLNRFRFLPRVPLCPIMCSMPCFEEVIMTL